MKIYKRTVGKINRKIYYKNGILKGKILLSNFNSVIFFRFHNTQKRRRKAFDKQQTNDNNDNHIGNIEIEMMKIKKKIWIGHVIIMMMAYNISLMVPYQNDDDDDNNNQQTKFFFLQMSKW